jgi:uncharacterized membrane protein
MGPPDARRPRTFARGELEFDRLAFFSDAIYAISLTLLVVGLDIPSIADTSSNRDLWDALDELQPEILMFFISFLVIGGFWLAHHRFVARLAAIDRPLMLGTIFYLAVIAFLPFPSGLLGEYSDNSVAVALYALCIAVVGSAEAVLFAIARKHGLLTVAPSDDVYLWGMVASLLPALVFLVSIPVAFVSPTLGIIFWVLAVPVGIITGWRMSERATEYFDES